MFGHSFRFASPFSPRKPLYDDTTGSSESLVRRFKTLSDQTFWLTISINVDKSPESEGVDARRGPSQLSRARQTRIGTSTIGQITGESRRR